MSSDPFRQYLESGDLAVIGSVLNEAGFGSADPHADAASKAAAARFLIREFQKGQQSRERLMLALIARSGTGPRDAQARKDASERWDDDGGQ